MKNHLLLVLLFVLTCKANGQAIPRVYNALFTSTPLTIDGYQEPAWDQALWSDDFIDIEGEKVPTYQTRVKMLWDSTYLYFFAQMEEPHVWGDITKRDAVIFYNNDFEVFIDPDGDTHNYMEFEMNALNTVWDLFLTKPYRNGPKVIDNWDIKGIQTAVQIDGSLNDPSDKDKGWTVEIAMPWSALLEASDGKLPLDDYWRINFSRVNWDFELNNGAYSRKRDLNGKYLPEYNWVWSPQGVINMHEPEHWGFVYFSANQKRFKVPYDELLRRKLYETYRQLHKRELILTDSSYFAIQFQGVEIPVSCERNKTGWNLYLISPETGSEIVIREDGQSMILTN
ncbi:carbohydrate-binding family 9-like protein [Marinoscillum sp.]|uniref:carbohydrate-binding family 9-like protein n=1 Tax=Marinoscillum sp. TaxID=2024838 RepID=UPI003BA9339A